jgi:8-oxo-dGTP pyrophosphatase MutT (NUDIX family)
MANLEAFFRENGCDPKTGRPQSTTVPPPSKPPKKPGFFAGLVTAFYGDKATPTPTSPAPTPIYSFASGGGSAKASSGGGFVSKASCGHSSRLHHVSKMGEKGHVSNIFALLILCDPKNSILLVQDKDEFLGFPGGKVDPTDLTPWNAVKREFQEEVGSVFPQMNGSKLGSSTIDPVKFQWEHLTSKTYTGFYCGHTDTTFSQIKASFLRNKEISDVFAFSPQQVLQIALGLDPKYKMRKCAQESTQAILKKIGLVA